MPIKLPDQFLRSDFTNAVVDSLAVADFLLPKNAVRKGINVVFDRPRGAVSQRYGTTKLGNTAGSAAILGLHNFRPAATAYNQLIAATGTVIKYLNSATWTNIITGLTSGLKTRFITFLDVFAVLNGTDAVQSWDGNGAVVTSGGPLDVANFPVTKFAVVLNGRILAAGNSTNPSRLYESSIVAAGAVSWTSGNRTTDVYVNDGSGAISGLASNGRVALVFKERAMFRYDGNELLRLAGVGTLSHESIITDDLGTTYFFGQGANSVGVYKTTGGTPAKISRPIQKYIEAIAASNYANIAAYTDGNKVVWAVGDLTIDGQAYTNCHIAYSLSDQTWEVYQYADRYRVFSQYIVPATGAITVVGGDNDFMVQTLNSGNTDNGDPIFSECEFCPETFLNPGTLKDVPDINLYARSFQGLKFFLGVDDKPFQEVCSVTGFVTYKGGLDIKGYRFYPKIMAENSQEPYVFEGYHFLNVNDHGYPR